MARSHRAEVFKAAKSRTYCRRMSIETDGTGTVFLASQGLFLVDPGGTRITLLPRLMLMNQHQVNLINAAILFYGIPSPLLHMDRPGPVSLKNRRRVYIGDQEWLPGERRTL